MWCFLSVIFRKKKHVSSATAEKIDLREENQSPDPGNSMRSASLETMVTLVPFESITCPDEEGRNRRIKDIADELQANLWSLLLDVQHLNRDGVLLINHRKMILCPRREVSRMQYQQMSAIVGVFGDLGRSPRMINHVNELIRLNYFVHLIGYPGDIEKSILSSKQVQVYFIDDWRLPILQKRLENRILNKIFGISGLLLRAVYLFSSLIFQLSSITWKTLGNLPKLMIIQTPPIIPLMLIAPLYCFLTGCVLVTDWHNLGFTLFDHQNSKSFGKTIYKWLEIHLGRLCLLKRSWRALCVSESMKGWISKNLLSSNDQVHVLYDRPTDKFKALSMSDRETIRRQLLPKIQLDPSVNPFIMVSSTSWTPDEDFGILFDAVKELEQILANKTATKKASRPVWLVVTGKGPLKEQYEHKFASLKAKNVQFKTVWLSPEDYPSLLAVSDLGVCLHTSSSGLDLPMKLIDMLGSGLPVCAYHYQCLEEVIAKNDFGWTFHDSNDLVKLLLEIIEDDTGNYRLLDKRKNIVNNKIENWSSEWRKWANKYF